MSAQSINTNTLKDILFKIDEYLISEGNFFRNIIDYDLKMKLDHNKIRRVLYLKDMLGRTKDCDKLILLIDKELQSELH